MMTFNILGFFSRFDGKKTVKNPYSRLFQAILGYLKNQKKLMKGSMRTFVTDRLTDGQCWFHKDRGVGKMLNHMNFEIFSG
jgi:hypothetical protein